MPETTTVAASAPRHLVTVWNPAYAADAMGAHLAVLLDHVARRGPAPDEDSVYVWWGKVRSTNRRQAYPHAADIRAIARALDEGARDGVHLYLTDYRSLYVADVSEIVEGDLPDGERAHVPGYYAEQRLACDFWFCLNDLRRLVADDTHGVIAELRALLNVHYGRRPVSIYGGMVDLPLIVERPDGAEFFAEDEYARLGGGRLWAEFDAEAGSSVSAVARSLREDRFGAALWDALEPSTRLFVAMAEHAYREHRDDLAADFAPVIGGLAKAIEVRCNAVLRRALAGAPREARLANVDGTTVDVTTRALTVGQLARAMGGERALNAALAARVEHGAWFTGQLPAILDEFAGLRNDAVHASRIDRGTAKHWRDRMIGVGCAGDLVELARVKVR